MPQGLGKLLIVLGVVLVALGIAVLLWGKVPWLGRLPGDITIVREGVTVYLPITTSLILSVIVSFLFYVFTRR